MGSRLSQRIGRLMAARLLKPKRLGHHKVPEDFGLRATSETVTTEDGLSLHLWVIPGSGAGTVLLGHGVGLTKSASLPHARLAHDLGYTTILFDHRNHGLSDSDPSREDLARRYSVDITAVAHFAREHTVGTPPLIGWGFSISTFSTLYTLWSPDSPLDAIISDSGPVLDLETSLERSAHELRFTRVVPFVSTQSLARSFAGAVIDMLGAEWPPESNATARTPILFLAGRDDTLFTPQQIRSLSDHFPRSAVRELQTGHLGGIKNDPEAYARAVIGFLEDQQTRPDGTVTPI